MIILLGLSFYPRFLNAWGPQRSWGPLSAQIYQWSQKPHRVQHWDPTPWTQLRPTSLIKYFNANALVLEFEGNFSSCHWNFHWWVCCSLCLLIGEVFTNSKPAKNGFLVRFCIQSASGSVSILKSADEHSSMSKLKCWWSCTSFRQPHEYHSTASVKNVKIVADGSLLKMVI